MEQIESFMMFRNLYDAIKSLNNEDLESKLALALLDYAFSGVVPERNEDCEPYNIIASFMVHQADRSIEYYFDKVLPKKIKKEQRKSCRE